MFNLASHAAFFIAGNHAPHISLEKPAAELKKSP
jgi:hypothetical protein